MLSNGTVCCSHADALCAKCTQHHATRTLAAHPLDSYEEGLRRRRNPPAPQERDRAEEMRAMSTFRNQLREQAFLASLRGVTPSTSKVILEPPDSYKIAIERKRA
jgi:hypothetical protein